MKSQSPEKPNPHSRGRLCHELNHTTCGIQSCLGSGCTSTPGLNRVSLLDSGLMGLNGGGVGWPKATHRVIWRSGDRVIPAGPVQVGNRTPLPGVTTIPEIAKELVTERGCGNPNHGGTGQGGY